MTGPVIQQPSDMRNYRKTLRGKVAVVPTMGALHDGHLSLVRIARKYAEIVVMTIFVNPTQFGPQEDFNAYPRTLESDLEKGRQAGVDCFFTPTIQDMYPDGYGTYVLCEAPVTQQLEGASRPAHFRGVTTIVLKLFNIIQPDAAIFGLKDYQQCAIIKKMVQDLDIPVQVVEAPTYREPDGLAMSSRNQYLSSDERQRALGIYRALRQALNALQELGETNLEQLTQTLHRTILTGPDVRLDYAKFVDPETLEPQSQFTGRTLLAIAAFVGKTRLIDNMLIIRQ